MMISEYDSEKPNLFHWTFFLIFQEIDRAKELLYKAKVYCLNFAKIVLKKWYFSRSGIYFPTRSLPK